MFDVEVFPFAFGFEVKISLFTLFELVDKVNGLVFELAYLFRVFLVVYFYYVVLLLYNVVVPVDRCFLFVVVYFKLVSEVAHHIIQLVVIVDHVAHYSLNQIALKTVNNFLSKC